LVDSIRFVVARTVHILPCVVGVCMKGPPYTERDAGPAQSLATRNKYCKLKTDN